MNKVEVRALAFSPSLPEKGETLEEYALKVSINLQGVVKQLEAELGRVRTLRLVLPHIELLCERMNARPEKVIEKLYEEASHFYDYLAFPIEDVDNLYLIRYLFENFEKTFSSIPFSIASVGYLSQTILELSNRLGYLAAAHFAVSFGSQPLTPYFPATAGGRASLMMSLLYPEYLIKALKSGVEISSAIETLAKSSSRIFIKAAHAVEVHAVNLLVDYSLSPWMDASSAKVIETLSGVRFGEPGTLSAIYEINEAIQSIAEKYIGGGFNEVMLPVAEDDRLKELVAEKAIKLVNLVSMVSTCVAGLDMVLLPAGLTVKDLSRLMMDLYSLSKVKGRVIGMRVIATELHPGSEVELGMFGRVPVIEV